MRAQKSLANIQRAEPGSSGSDGSVNGGLERHGTATRAAVIAEERLYKQDYVEARGLLLPATEYLQRAVDSARAQGALTGSLLSAVNSRLQYCQRVLIHFRLQKLI